MELKMKKLKQILLVFGLVFVISMPAPDGPALIIGKGDQVASQKTPAQMLQQAAMLGDLQTVLKVLRKNSKQLTLSNLDKALLIACNNNHSTIATVILLENPKVGQRNMKDQTLTSALIWTAYYNMPTVTAQLLARNVAMNHFNDQGFSALSVAAVNGYVDVVALLLNEGADVSIKNKNGETALDQVQKEYNAAQKSNQPTSYKQEYESKINKLKVIVDMLQDKKK